ncbi:MAG: threonine/serine exporter family protein [Anaeromassilibacillus sp.]
MNYDDLISAATDVGYLLLRNGAEIYRVEDSMQRIFRAYGVETGKSSPFHLHLCDHHHAGGEIHHQDQAPLYARDRFG